MFNLAGRVRRVAVFCLMYFLDTAPNGVHANVRETDARIWNQWIIPCLKGCLVLLLPRPIAFICELGEQNIARGPRIAPPARRSHWIMSIRSIGRRSLDTFGTNRTRIPRLITEHSLNHYDGKGNEAKPLVATSRDVPCRNIADYYVRFSFLLGA